MRRHKGIASIMLLGLNLNFIIVEVRALNVVDFVCVFVEVFALLLSSYQGNAWNSNALLWSYHALGSVIIRFN